MILIVVLIALAALTIWVAARHNWNWQATFAALGATAVAVWQALWHSLSGGASP